MKEKPEILRENGAAGMVLLCDHASNRIPPEYKRLGLKAGDLQKHIAWDIGAGGITRALSQVLDAPAVLATFSRLLVDPNRELDDMTLFLEVSDGITIPGNHNLTRAEKERRLRRFYHPYHGACEAVIRARFQSHPAIIGIHTFSPIYGGESRTLEFAVMWNRDERLARRVGAAFEGHGYKVGWNEPYSGHRFFGTMDRHGAGNRLPHVTIEVRQDLVARASGQKHFARLIAECLREVSLKGL